MMILPFSPYESEVNYKQYPNEYERREDYCLIPKCNLDTQYFEYGEIKITQVCLKWIIK